MKNTIMRIVLLFTVSSLHTSAPAAAAATPKQGSLNLRATRLALMQPTAKTGAHGKAAQEPDGKDDSKKFVPLSKAQLVPRPTTPEQEATNFHISDLKKITVELSPAEIEALGFKKESVEAATQKATMGKLLGMVAVKPLPATMKDDGTPTYELNASRRAQLGYSTHPDHSFKRGERVLVSNSAKEYVYGIVVKQQADRYLVQINFDAPLSCVPAALGKKS